MAIHIDELLSRFEYVKPNGKDKWMCRCSAHNDRGPSLSIRLLPDGRILIWCFAGCGAADILAAIGLSLRDLYPDGALDHHMRGIRSHNKDASYYRTVLAIADADRAAGKKLTTEDLEIERDAFLQLRRLQPTNR